MSDQTTTEKRPRQRSSGLVIWVTALGWVALSGIAYALAGDTLPFDRPALADASPLTQIVNGWLNLPGAGILIVIAYAMTRRRAVPDMAARAPERSQAIREVGLLVGYILLAQVTGYAIGHTLGAHAISLHLPGALFGTSNPPTTGW